MLKKMLVTTIIPDGEQRRPETLGLFLVATRDEQDWDSIDKSNRPAAPAPLMRSSGEVSSYVGEAQGVDENGRRVWIPAVWGDRGLVLYGITCRYQD